MSFGDKKIPIVNPNERYYKIDWENVKTKSGWFQQFYRLGNGSATNPGW